MLYFLLSRGFSYLSGLLPRRQKNLSGIDYWNDRAKRYGRRSVINVSHPEEAYDRVTLYQKSVLLPLLKSQLRGHERTALDYGCGPGRFTRDLAEAIQGRCIGVDPVIDYLDLAPSSERTRYALLENARIPLPDSSVDIVWICLVLGAVSSPEELEIAKLEIDRVLADDGLVFLVENTTRREDTGYWAYRDVEYYRKLLDFLDLKCLSYYLDFGERISIMAGRRITRREREKAGEEPATARLSE